MKTHEFARCKFFEHYAPLNTKECSSQNSRTRIVSRIIPEKFQKS